MISFCPGLIGTAALLAGGGACVFAVPIFFVFVCVCVCVQEPGVNTQPHPRNFQEEKNRTIISVTLCA